MDKKTSYRWFKAISGTIFVTIFGIWMLIILLQVGEDVDSNNGMILRDYAQISMTLFAITFVGGIFDKRDNKKDEYVYKELFRSSIIFLISSMLFLIIFSIISIGELVLNEYTAYIIISGMLMAIVLFILGVLILLFTLIERFIYPELSFSEGNK